MKIITNQKYIKRNQKIGKYLTIGSIIVLIAGMFITFQPNYWTWSLVAMLVGFTGSQFAIYYSTRFGRSPRPDEQVSNALKGLNDQYALYHYITPASHLLVGPAGIWAILPYHQRGQISYDDQRNRWKQKGGNLYLKIFAQEGLGRPDLDVRATLADTDKYLADAVQGTEPTPAASAVLLFTNPKVEIDAKESPYPAVSPEKLKDLFRRKAKTSPLPNDVVKQIQAILPGSPVE